MEENGQVAGQPPVARGARVSEQPSFRFAVATFEAWLDARMAAEALQLGPRALTRVSYLALHDVLAREPTLTICALPFPGAAPCIACSVGPIAARLLAKLETGAPTLQAALGTWLIPRHAAQLQSCVEKGKIVLWVQLVDNEDERSAYRTLLAAGCKSVGVHDLVGD